jgi:hypothetical protein
MKASLKLTVLFLGASFLVLCSISGGAEPQQDTGQPQGSNPAIQSGQVSVTTAPASDQQVIEELTHRVRKLELEVLQKAPAPKDNGPLIAAVTAIAVSFLALIGQFFLALREDRRAARAAERAVELARQEALLRQQEKLLDFRLKQMETFYAPMRALLTQTRGLYDKMGLGLIQDDPKHYRWATSSDPNHHRVEVHQPDGSWAGFRLLDQFPAVKKDPRALALADQVLTIGKELTGIITQHAGLASGDLLDLLGQYMSHYAILSAIRNEPRTEPYPPGFHEIGYYPRELDDRIADGYREVAKLINQSVSGSFGLDFVSKIAKES